MPLVVVGGALANKPGNGGAAWTRMSWTLGFRQLGCQVFFLEQIAREACVDAAGKRTTFENSTNAAFFRRVTERFGLDASAALIYEQGEQILGATYADLLGLAESADLLVNITGQLSIDPLFRRFKCKAYVDLDPGFTQIWHADGVPMHLEDHDLFFTVGENIGTPDCSLPTNGIDWRPIRQPVVLQHWPVSTTERSSDRFTTVASWRGPYGPVDFEGSTLGLKVHEFRKIIRLPQLVLGSFELALDIHASDAHDLTLLQQHGWRVVDPSTVAATPDLFRRYVQMSGAECSVAQGVYVTTHSGWFSDRTVRYLASGKPALVQDTGFTRRYGSGHGLIAFSTLDEAVAGAERIMRDYASHSQAARALVEEHFAAHKVLPGLLREAGVVA
jgi:hypothetical protein